MKLISALIRLLLIAGMIFCYLTCGFVLGLFVRDRWKLVQARARNISFWSRVGLILMGVKASFLKEGHRFTLADVKKFYSGNYLLVSNHLGYLDVLVMCQLMPACFVTSKEIEKTPVLGLICKWGGCLFVDRRSRKNLPKEISEITEALAQGCNVAIFPEATSTNGETILRFKRPLFNSAMLSGRQVLPVCLNYTDVSGAPLNSVNRDSVFWYGDMSFVPHLWRVLLAKEIKVDLVLNSPLETQNQTDLELAEVSHKMVSIHFQPCLG